MSLIKQLQEGEIALEFNRSDQSEDLQKVMKVAFPNDSAKPTGSSRYYWCRTDIPVNERVWLVSDDINMKTVALSEFLKELEDSSPTNIVSQMREGKVAIFMDSHTGEAEQRLKEIIAKAFPKAGKPSGWCAYYCKANSQDTWDYWGEPYQVEGKTIVPITTLLKSMSKEIVGYKLAKPEYNAAAAKICGYSLKMDKITDSHYAGYDLNFLLDSDDRRSLEKAGVLDLWFEPVYKKEIPKIKIGEYTGTIDKEKRAVMIEGVVYTNVFIGNLVDMLSTRYIHSINVGCNGQIQLTRTQLQDILNQL